MKVVAVIETQFGYDQIFKGLLSSEAYQELIAYQAFNDVVDFINAGEYEIEEGQQYNAILEWGGPYSDIGVEKVVDIFKSKVEDAELLSYQTIEKNIPIYTKYFDFMAKEYPETFMYPGISVEAEYDPKENCVYGTIRQRSPGNFGEDREAYIRIWGHRDIYITKYFD